MKIPDRLAAFSERAKIYFDGEAPRRVKQKRSWLRPDNDDQDKIGRSLRNWSGLQLNWRRTGEKALVFELDLCSAGFLVPFW
jgi:hypothetical protein